MYALARDVTVRRALEVERAALIAELQSTLAQVRTLSSMLPTWLYPEDAQKNAKQRGD